MKKINSLFSDSQFNPHNQLNQLAKKAQSHQLLQQFWAAVADQLIIQHTFVGSIINGQLTIYASSAIVASKIKLIQTKLLTQLQHLQQTKATFRECKVTAIVVKVQVKSTLKPAVKVPRKLTKNAADSLKNLAENLGDSALSAQLKSLANKV